MHPPHYPYDGTYADLLAWHLEYWGTRPEGNTANNGKPWDKKKFGSIAFAGNSEDSARTGLSNWLGAKGAPNETSHSLIQKALFGDNPLFDAWRIDLEKARKQSPQGRNQRTKKFPLPPPIQSSRSSIPRLTAEFVGRNGDVEALSALVASPNAPQAILVQGGPGIGKTELTKAIAHHPAVVARFSERRYFVPLETAPGAEAMQHAIMRAIGCDPQHGFATALSALFGKQTLIVLDNLETPWQKQCAATEQALAELAAMTGAVILASFRGREAVGGPKWYNHEVGPLPLAAAIDLFVSIAGTTVANDPDRDHFITELGGLPLAIELIAKRAHGRSALAPLLREWANIGAKLVEARTPAPDRSTSLPVSIEISLSGIGDAEWATLLFRLLGEAPGGISGADLQDILGPQSFEATERLVHSGLCFERNDRVQLLPPIRDYASRYHEPQQPYLETIHFHFVKKFVRAAPDWSHVLVPDQINKLRTDFINGMHSLAYIVEFGLFDKYPACVQAVGRVYRFFYLTDGLGYWAIFDRIADSCMATGHLGCEADARRLVGDFCRGANRREVAAAAYEKAAGLYQAIGDIHSVRHCLAGLINVSADMGRKIAHAENLQDLCLKRGDVSAVAWYDLCLARDAIQLSEYDAAITYFEKAIVAYCSIGNRSEVMLCFSMLAQIHSIQGDHEKATAVETRYSSYRTSLGL